MFRIIMKPIVFLGTFFMVAYSLWDMLYNGGSISDNIDGICGFVVSCVTVFHDDASKRNPPIIYRTIYWDVLRGVFVGKRSYKRLLLAIRLLDEGQTKAALRAFRLLLKCCKTPDDFCVLYYFIAQCYMELEKYDLSEDYLNRSFQTGKVLSRAYTLQGELRVKQGRMDEAIEHFQHALQFDEKHIDHICVCLGGIYLEKMDLQNAATWGNAAIQANPDACDAGILLTLVYTLLGDEETANKYYRLAVHKSDEAIKLDRMIKTYQEMYREKFQTDTIKVSM